MSDKSPKWTFGKVLQESQTRFLDLTGKHRTKSESKEPEDFEEPASYRIKCNLGVIEKVSHEEHKISLTWVIDPQPQRDLRFSVSVLGEVDCSIINESGTSVTMIEYFKHTEPIYLCVRGGGSGEVIMHPYEEDFVLEGAQISRTFAVDSDNGVRAVKSELWQREQSKLEAKLSSELIGDVFEDPEAYLESLPELVFEVVKLNRWGKRQNRTLKLTARGLENIRENGYVSSVAEWKNITAVYLKSSNVIGIRLMEKSKSATERLYEVPTRVHELLQVIRMQKQNYMKANKRVLIKHMLDKQKEKQSKRKTRKRKLPDSMLESVYQPHFKDTMCWAGEDEVREEIERILVDVNQETGKFKQHFFEDFAGWKSDSATFLTEIRKSLSKLQKYVVQEYHTKLSEILQTHNPKRPTYDVSKRLDFLIEQCIERIFLNPIMSEINEIVEKDTDQITDHIKYNVFFLRKKSQSFFNIRKKVQSKVNYDTAVIEIQRMRDEVLPMDKLNCLVACAHAVHNEKIGCEITGDDLMSIVIWILIRASVKFSDDGQPVITQKDLVIMTELGDPNLVVNGEHGYCLTVFTGAIQWICNYKPETEEKKKRTVELLDQLGF